MFKSTILLLVIVFGATAANATEHREECIEKENFYGYSITYWEKSKNVTLALGKYGRANYFAHYKLVDIEQDVGGRKEFYELTIDSPFPSFRSWPVSFEVDFFTRVASNPNVSLYIPNTSPVYMDCNF